MKDKILIALSRMLARASDLDVKGVGFVCVFDSVKHSQNLEFFVSTGGLYTSRSDTGERSVNNFARAMGLLGEMLSTYDDSGRFAAEDKVSLRRIAETNEVGGLAIRIDHKTMLYVGFYGAGDSQINLEIAKVGADYLIGKK